MTDQKDYRQLLDERFAHLTTLMNANHKEAMDSNDRIEKHVKETNGRVNCLEIESLKREEAVRDFRKLERDISAVKRTLRQKWMLFLLGGILFVVSVILVYDMGAFPKLFNWLINKAF
jgi:hypothetical protein